MYYGMNSQLRGRIGEGEATMGNREVVGVLTKDIPFYVNFYHFWTKGKGTTYVGHFYIYKLLPWYSRYHR